MADEASSQVPAAPATALAPQDFCKDPAAFLQVVSEPVRWAVLRELAAGSSRSVVELSAVARRQPDVMSRHLKTLRAAGAVVLVDSPDGDGRKQHYAVPEKFRRMEADKPVIDYGVCVLRFS